MLHFVNQVPPILLVPIAFLLFQLLGISLRLNSASSLLAGKGGALHEAPHRRFQNKSALPLFYLDTLLCWLRWHRWKT